VPPQASADDQGRGGPGWPGGQGGPGWPGGRGELDDDDWADDDWPGDVVWPADTDQGVPWAGDEGVAWAGDGGAARAGEAGRGPDRGRDGWFGRVGWLAAVAVVAAVAGAGLTVGLTRAPTTPTAAASSPATLTPGGSGGGSAGAGGGAVPVPNGGSEVSHIEMIGTVTAVSATSITIGGQGLSVTATVTSATRVTGRVGSIQQIRVGDQVSAEMTQSGSKVTAVAIQYPAQEAPPGQP
jgi:hypothetical protein